LKQFLLISFGLMLAAAAQAQTLSQVYAFDSCPAPYYACPDGAKPGSIIQASDGNLYGLTESSNGMHGTQIGGWYEGGSLFKIVPSTGQFTLLFTFKATNGYYSNGSQPKSLLEGPDGYLYGVADGANNSNPGAGVLFKVSKTGTNFQVLQRYCFGCTNGSDPDDIVVGTDRNLYGTTQIGGSFTATICQGLGCGLVFRLTTSGAYTVLHALNGTNEGSYPNGVIQASDGNLYGTTYTAPGILFRVNPSTGQFTTLYTFPSGIAPITPVMQASNGLLYGVSKASTGGNLTIFSSDLKGSVQNLGQVTCTRTKVTGFILGKLIEASDGNLWGVCNAGGSTSYGEVFSVTLAGNLVTTVPFHDTDGAYPEAGVIQAKDGTLYGTTFDGGTDSQGKLAYGNVYAIHGLPAVH